MQIFYRPQYVLVQHYIKVRSLLVTTFDSGTHFPGIIEVKLIVKCDTENQSKYRGLMALVNFISNSSIKLDILVFFLQQILTPFLKHIL